MLEILSAELTLSPTYTAAWGQIKDEDGLAMRFPRFTDSCPTATACCRLGGQRS